MAEALISRGGSGSGSGGSYKLFTEIINTNREFTVPKCKDQKLRVILFGGGGGGGAWSGGGGGNMVVGDVDLMTGSVVSIIIGKGGNYAWYNNSARSWTAGSSGGTTFFGSYLSAIGGQCGDSKISSTGEGGGGNGGSGGGGGQSQNGGDGWIFGGGGCGYVQGATTNRGGNGGIYGGGGGGSSSMSSNIITYGIGGTYGGNGGGYNNISGAAKKMNAENGTNTIGLNDNNIFLNGNTNGGPGLSGLDKTTTGTYQGCGGGGYGGNGGGFATVYLNNYNYTVNTWGSRCGSGGGGGYGNGADGGPGVTAWTYNSSIIPYGGGGGGGGFYARGGRGSYCTGGGGGGYGISGYGGNGGWRDGGIAGENGGIAAGGGGGAKPLAYPSSFENEAGGFGGNGICIIQYYGLIEN